VVGGVGENHSEDTRQGEGSVKVNEVNVTLALVIVTLIVLILHVTGVW
jgi:hypothetical protein